MPYICGNCRLAVNKKYTNCPSCGFQLREDSRSLEEWERLGYRIPGKRRNPAEEKPRPEQTGASAQEQFQIDDEDYLNQLRNGYARAQQQNAQPEKTGGGSSEAGNEGDSDPFFRRSGTTQRAPAEERVPPQPDSRQREGAEDAGDDRFFRRRSAGANASQEVHRPADQAPPQSVDRIPPEPVPRERRRPRLHVDFLGVWYGFWNFLSLIPWRAVFTLVVIGLIVGVVMTIWNMRYAIVSAVLNFVIELIPIVLILGGIVYLIRALFR